MAGKAVGQGGNDHAALMDAVYRHQRHIYDVTRAWYLLGRDRLIAALDPAPGARVLEVACGTGRNLHRIGRRYPEAALFGFDISSEMLQSAQARLGAGKAARARLALGDACTFDPQALFGVPGFDRVVLSYCLSMIPDWEAALDRAVAALAPGGVVHIVDFHDQAGLPGWFGAGLRGWLARFHVTPRDELAAAMARVAARHHATARHHSILRGYAQIGTITRPVGTPEAAGQA